MNQRLDGNNPKNLTVRLVIRKRHAEGRISPETSDLILYKQRISGVYLKPGYASR